MDPNTADGANVQEEHEREIAHEVEQETQIQRPDPAKSIKESVNGNLKMFIKTESQAVLKRFRYADSIVRKSSAVKLLDKKIV